MDQNNQDTGGPVVYDCVRCGLPILSRPVLVVETGILHGACAAEDEAEWEARMAARKTGG